MAKFALIGGIATILHASTVIVLVEIFSFDAALAAIPAFILALSISYLANHSWTFKKRGGHCGYFPKFVLAAIGGLSINWIIMCVIVNLVGWNYLIALGIVIVVLPLLSFTLNYKWIFISGGSGRKAGLLGQR